LSKRKRKPRIPEKSLNAKKERRLDVFINNMIIYRELARSAIPFMKKDGRLTPELNYRLIVEANFIFQILTKMLNVSVPYIRNYAERIREDEGGWMAEVEKFSEMLSPRRGILVTDNIEKEMEKILYRGRMGPRRTGGKL